MVLWQKIYKSIKLHEYIENRNRKQSVPLPSAMNYVVSEESILVPKLSSNCIKLIQLHPCYRNIDHCKDIMVFSQRFTSKPNSDNPMNQFG